jgi:predicted ATPase/DNA-binding SARP family transcriptional activator
MMEQELRVRVLGGAELAVSGRPLAGLASAKATALLVYLAVTGEAHSRSALAGLLWSDLPEQTARANLRLVLTKLRRVLPDHLSVTRQAVALAPGRPVWVDAVEVARVAAGERDDGELLAAVRLCRGDLLEGFGPPGAPLFDEWLVGRRAAVRADMLAVMDRAVTLARDRDDTATGVEVARRMLELEPLHEEAHRALMWFLARGGQRSAALAQYETCRYVLREELGVEPSAATAALRDEIAGAGGFTELDTPRPGGAARTPPAATARAAATAPDLPLPLTTLVGRAQELARLRELLDDPACRLVTLVGPGGIGKTRLALEVAAAREDRHRDGTVFVSFVGTSPAQPEDAADLVVADLARALGVSLAVPRDPLELLADHLAGRELLLVLDNLEQLRDAAAALAELLRRAPGVQVLVTSRRRLGLGVEWLVEVPGLPYPPAGAGAEAAGYEAVQLFEERARLLRSGSLAADAEGVARACRLLAGVPLAIELAARTVRSASPAVIADRLAGGLDLLDTSSPDVERRHRSLRSVIDWSWQLLTDDERRVLRRLSVLRGGFDLEAAAAVAGATLPLLAALVDQSLVTAGEDGRYDMHELLRQYAAERLAADPADERAIRRRHAEHYAALLPDPARPATAVDEGGLDAALDAEIENLRAATDWLVEHGDPPALDRHLARLWPLYRRRGWFREAQAVLGAALRRPEDPVSVRAGWHRLLAEAHLQLGEMAPARDHFERALDLLGSRVPSSGPGWSEVLVSQALQRPFRRLRPGGPAARRQDRRDRAAEPAAVCWQLMEACWMLEDQAPLIPLSLWGLNLSERAGRVELAMMNQASLGNVLTAAGHHRLARRHVRAAVAAAGQTSDPLAVTWTQIVASLHWLGVGDWAALDAGLPRALEAGYRGRLHRAADQVVLLGGVCRYLTGRFEEAEAMAAQARVAGRDRHDRMVQLWGLLVLVESRLRTDPGDPAIAGALEEAEPLLTSGIAAADAARFHVAAARFHLAAGRTPDAWRETRTAADLAGPEPSFAPYTLEAHAGVPEVSLALLELGEPPGTDPAEVRATAAAGLRRLRRYARRFPMARPRALACLAWSHRLQGRPAAASRAWARALREADRLVMPWEQASAHQELGRHLRPDERSPLGLTGAEHLDRARSAFEALGLDVRDRGRAWSARSYGTRPVGRAGRPGA